ncbi:hypothetical protein J7E97_18650 [Streptomyces sp. ISL-66]|nr:hypothetical protein [Streptomyces sp. ISL-66]
MTHVHSPSVFYASINAQGTSVGVPGPDPAAMLQAKRREAHKRKDLLLRTDPRFSRMPRFLKAEVLAGILVELIQLAGRARRGGTPVELYLVDHAFFNLSLGCDFPGLLRTYYTSLEPGQQQILRRIYGSTSPPGWTSPTAVIRCPVLSPSCPPPPPGVPHEHP